MELHGSFRKIPKVASEHTRDLKRCEMAAQSMNCPVDDVVAIGYPTARQPYNLVGKDRHAGGDLNSRLDGRNGGFVII